MTVKLNIIVASDSCEVDGGASLVALEDARSLAQLGHRVIYFSACGEPPSGPNNIEWISLGQNTILDEPNRWKAAMNGLWNWRAARRLSELLLTLPPDSTVIHLHSWSKVLSGSVVRAASRRDYRMGCTLHDYFSVCPNGGLYDYPTRHICTLKPMSVQCMARNCDSRVMTHKIWRVIRQLIWRHMAGIPLKFDQMIAVSGFSARKISELLGGTEITVIDNLPTLIQHELVPAAERRMIVYAGRVAAEKGVDVYLAACRIAKLPAHVWGDGPALPELKQAWPEAAFSGWLSKEELGKRLRSVEALVVPSLWYENSPMIIAEAAAAAGVPVIVSDNGAAATLVENGITGWHFKAGDAADLATKMAELSHNPNRAFQTGKTAYRDFWSNYADRQYQRIKKLETCYMQALAITQR